MERLGAHLDSDNLISAMKKINLAGGNIIQIFMSSNPDLSLERINKLKTFMQDTNMAIVIHSSYTHNLSRDWDKYSWWISNIELEIKYARVIGALGIVIHFGKSLDLSIEEAYNNMYTALIYIHKKTLEYAKVKIFLETPAGQGTEICHRLEDLAYFYKKISLSQVPHLSDRIKLCVDTCHVFAAGYDISTPGKVNEYLKIFDKLVGIGNIQLIHLNDSKMKLGNRKDRHENIGNGYIGIEGLGYFYSIFNNLHVPIVLETPGYGFVVEIKALKKIDNKNI